MIRDAEQHANDDAKKKELVETRNLAEGMITSTDKMLEENSDKATDEEKDAINNAKDALKTLLEKEELTLDELKASIEELTKASQSFAEKLYAETQAAQDNQSETPEDVQDVVEGEVVEEDE